LKTITNKKLHQFAKLSLLNILFAVAYLLLAKFGLMWGLLTSGVSLLWPPAGLVFFGFLLYGARVAPGFILGSLVAMQYFYFDSSLGRNLTSLSLSAWLTLGAVSQGWCLSLIHRQCFPNNLIVSPRAVLFYTGSVFLCCTIAATLGHLGLWYLQLIPSYEIVQSWILWWMGDSIGILIFTALLVGLFLPQVRKNNLQAQAFLLLSAGLGVVLFSTATVGYMERITEKNNFNMKTNALTRGLNHRVDRINQNLEALNYYFLHVKPDLLHFQQMANSFLASNQSLQGLAWVPVVFADENTQMKWLLSEAPDWFYAGKFSGSAATETLITAPENKKTILAAANHSAAIASAITYSFPQGLNHQPSILLLMPVRDCSNNNMRSCSVLGVIVLAMDINLWMRDEIAQQTDWENDFVALSLYTRDDAQNLWRWQENQWQQQSLGHSGAYSIIPQSIEAVFVIANKSFVLNIVKIKNTLAYFPSGLQFSVLAIGLALTGLLTAYLIMRQKHDDLLGRNQTRLESEIEEQTQALREANEWLLGQIRITKETKKHLEISQIELKIREQQLRSVLDNIPDPIWLKDTGGVYISCNPAFATMIGKKEIEIIGNTQEEIVSVEMASEFRDRDMQAIKSLQPLRYEQWIPFGHDQKKHLLDTLKVAIRNEQGTVVSILGIGRDISEKHALVEKAEEAVRAKGRFLANMSHEIRTPLNAVLGYSQLLMRDQNINQQQRERLQSILTASQRLLALINDILDLSKIEAGVFNLRKEYFDLHREIDEVKTIIAERAQHKNLQLITQVDLPTPYIVKGDKHKIGQILINLLGNSVKFTTQGSVSLYVAAFNDQVEFVIGDTGQGISETDLNELFAAFKQGKAGEEAGGTGLGLALSRRLAEAMGGNLSLSSVLGQGTLAHLCLPLQNEKILMELNTQQQQWGRLLAGTECKVLVVEDDQASSDILVDLLRHIGCDTKCGHDGSEGLLLCAGHSFDIIFTDIRMPKMNGLEFLQKLRNMDHYKNIPIIAVSASSLEHERAYYMEQGFQDFVGKPYAFEEIFAALQKHLQLKFNLELDGPDKSDLKNQKITSSDSINNPVSDLTEIVVDLEELKIAAASGDRMTCKKIYERLSEDQLGKQRKQLLQTALQDYDLERIERLVSEWLKAQSSRSSS
jgi:two-component system, OmpR family, aerobic respiration control sensor histidine kinase ArcB